MSRREFTTKVRVAAIKRAAGLCEALGCGLPHLDRFQIDHVIADALGGEPVLSNAMLMCLPCHSAKTKLDTTAAAKTKRQEAAHLKATPVPRQPIRSTGFKPSPRRHVNPMPTLPYRSLYR